MSTAREFDTWAAAVVRELAALGLDNAEAKHVPCENEDWFRAAFEDGQVAVLVPAEWFNYD